MALLAREDGSWDWVPPSDYRVAEVRLLHGAGTVGDPAADNVLIRGDALNALASLTETREYAKRYVGQAKLAYLDPPLNTQRSFLHYDDALEHSLWLTMMRDRLEQVRKLLTPDGSVWVHCDDSEHTAGADHICAGAGMDVVYALGGDDFVWGGGLATI